MLIDIAYALRQILIETGLSDDEVIGILPFATCQRQTENYLAPANALACLQELRYYNIAGHYPGEPACGLAGFQSEIADFRAHTYFLDLGEHLSDLDFAEEINKVASYILLNAVTPANPFFDAARTKEKNGNPTWICRSARSQLQPCADSHDVSSELIDRFCRAVVLNWRGSGVADPASKSRRTADRTSVTDQHANEVFVHRLASAHATEAGLDLRLFSNKAMLRH